MDLSRSMTSYMTVVGAGRYGSELLGNVLSDRRLPDTQLTAYVDSNPNVARLINTKIWQQPGLQIIEPGQTFESRQDGTVPLFKTTADWAVYAAPLKGKMVVDIALPSEQAPKALTDYLDLGVRQFVLPKPFTYDEQTLDTAVDKVAQAKAKTAVTSTWFYSGITAFVRDQLKALTPKYPIEKVELNYSTYVPLPNLSRVTLDELPHAVQILSSTGLIEPERDKPTVTEASQHRADFSYHPHAVNEQVAVHCYTDYKSDTPTGRTRKLEVYLADGDSEPDIVANYDVKFDASGKLAIPGSVTVDVPGTRLTQAFPEDTITLTYQKILNAFKKPYEQAQKDPSILTLENYKPIAQQVATIHHQWTTLMAAK